MTAPKPTDSAPRRRSSRRVLLTAIGLVAAGVVVVAGSAPSQAAIGDITTLVGDGRAGYTGDAGPAGSAQLSGPAALAFDAAGNLYVADASNNVIRKVTTAGTISTFAGNGQYGYSGDNGLATGAKFAGPSGLAFDSSGQLFVADTQNGVIRRIDSTGTISTIAGGGTPADGIGNGGLATAAALGSPVGIAFDAAGNLYIAEADNARVRKVDTTGHISTAVGGGSPASGNGDNGPATAAKLARPLDVKFDTVGRLYVSDIGMGLVRRIDTAGVISTFAGSPLNAPYGLAFDGLGDLFIGDAGTNIIHKLDTSGVMTTVAGGGTPADGLGDNGPATQAALNQPAGIVVTSAGNLLIADFSNNRVRQVAGVVPPTTTTVAPTTTTVAPTTTTVAPTTTTVAPTTTTVAPTTTTVAPTTTTVAPTTTTVAPTTTTVAPTTTTVAPTTTTVAPTTTTVAPTTTTVAPTTTTTSPPAPPTTLVGVPPATSVICGILDQLRSAFSFLGPMTIAFDCGTGLPITTSTTAPPPTTTTVAPTTTVPSLTLPPTIPGLDRVCDILARLRQAFPFLRLNILDCP